MAYDEMLRPGVEDLEAQFLLELRRGMENLQAKQERLVHQFAQRLLKAETRVCADLRCGSEPTASQKKLNDGLVGSDETDVMQPPPRPVLAAGSSFFAPGASEGMVRAETGESAMRLTPSQKRHQAVLRTNSMGLSGTDYLHQFDQYSGIGWFASACRWWMDLEEPERDGRLARFVMSNRFEVFTLVMIMLNGALVIYQTDKVAAIAATDPSKVEQQTGWDHWDQIVENVFAFFFIVELLLRVTVHRLYFFCNQDMWWNIFDVVTVVATFVDFVMGLLGTTGERMDVALLRAIRLFRMTRSLRIFRALHFIRALRQLMDCIISSFGGLFWCIVLLLFFTLIFATFLVQCATTWWVEDEVLTEEQRLASKLLEENFGSIPSAMLSLFQATSGGNDWGYYYGILKVSGMLGPLLLVTYIIFFIIAAWNIVTSLFIEKALSLAQPDQDQQMMQKKRQDLNDARDLLEIIKTLDDDNSGTLSINEFKRMMREPRIQDFFTFKSIDIKDAEMFFHMLEAAVKSKEIRTETVVNGLMRMRGVATNLDLQSVTFQITHLANETDRCLRELYGLHEEVRHLVERAPAAENEEPEPLEESLPAKPMSTQASSNRRLSKAMRSVVLDIASLGLSPKDSPRDDSC